MFNRHFAEEAIHARGKKLAWQGFADLIAGDSTIKPAININFEDRPGIYTIQFNTSQQPSDPSHNPIQSLAIITWKVEGQFIRRLVTIGNGTTISGTGQALSVDLQDVTPPVFGPVVPGLPPYTVSVTVTPGCRPFNVQGPIFIPSPGFFFVAQGAARGSIAIPQNAGVTAVSVQVAGSPARAMPEGEVQVAQGIALVNFNVYDPRVAEWIPLYPGAVSLFLINNSTVAGNGIFYTVSFLVDG